MEAPGVGSEEDNPWDEFAPKCQAPFGGRENLEEEVDWGEAPGVGTESEARVVGHMAEPSGSSGSSSEEDNPWDEFAPKAQGRPDFIQISEMSEGELIDTAVRLGFDPTGLEELSREALVLLMQGLCGASEGTLNKLRRVDEYYKAVAAEDQALEPVAPAQAAGSGGALAARAKDARAEGCVETDAGPAS